MDCEKEMVISAALDGERVDLDILRGALSDEDGPKTLASFVLLRAEVAADDTYSSRSLHIADSDTARSVAAEAGGRWSAARAPAESSWRHLTFAVRCRRIGVAAVLATLAMAGAFWFGTVWRPAPPDESAGRTVRSDEPPAHIGAPEFQPGNRATGGKAPSVEDRRFDGSTGPLQRILPAEPPEATRVLRYLPGTDWLPDLF